MCRYRGRRFEHTSLTCALTHHVIAQDFHSRRKLLMGRRIECLTLSRRALDSFAMANEPKPEREQFNMRLTPEDLRLLAKLQAKLEPRIGTRRITHITRLAWRRLAETEGIRY